MNRKFKVLISDTHGYLGNLKEAIAGAGAGFDLLLHMGDIDGQEAALREMLIEPVPGCKWKL